MQKSCQREISDPSSPSYSIFTQLSDRCYILIYLLLDNGSVSDGYNLITSVLLYDTTASSYGTVMDQIQNRYGTGNDAALFAELLISR